MANERGWKALALASSALIAMLIAVVVVIHWWSSTTVVLLVRHAERDDTASCTPGTSDPPLAAAGQTRAAALAHVAEDTGLHAIYASEFCRTQQTVQPVATQLGITVTVVNQFSAGGPDVTPLVDRMRRDNEGQRVLVAGHSDTVPMIIDQLGGGAVAPIGGTEFDNLYVVTILRLGFVNRTRVVRLKYGEPS